MAWMIFLCAVILLVCIISGKLSDKVGVPALLLFLVLGMLFGSDGIFGIEFDNYGFAEQICSVALIFIMFYGGFETNWKAARSVAAKSFLLASAGVVVTALITGLFCHLILKMTLLEGMLIGAIIGSTDAASVFSILRSKNLNLKHGLASLLELESGSNDPTAYTMMVVLLGFISGKGSSPALTAFLQITVGLACGFAIAAAAAWLLRRFSYGSSGMQTIFVVAVALLAYAVPSLIGGNGYLSVYIAGIILGNSRIRHKIELVHFFDGVTGMMQILIFFTLGLLCFPSQIPGNFLSALTIALILTFLSRPIAVALILTPFRVPFRQQLLVSWAGLRGAASIVFAIVAVVSDAYTKNDIFHIVFCVALLSVGFQGTLLPVIARKLQLVDDSESVLKTFNDYQDTTSMNLIEIEVTASHHWAGRTLRELDLPDNFIFVLVKREGRSLLPKGDTVILEGDSLVLNCEAYQDNSDVKLYEEMIGRNHRWKGLMIRELDLEKNTMVTMIKRDALVIIPHGDTRIESGDILVLGKLAGQHLLEVADKEKEAGERELSRNECGAEEEPNRKEEAVKLEEQQRGTGYFQNGETEEKREGTGKKEGTDNKMEQ